MTSGRFQTGTATPALLFPAALPTNKKQENELPNCDSRQIAINRLPASAKLLYPGKWEATTLNRYT